MNNLVNAIMREYTLEIHSELNECHSANQRWRDVVFLFQTSILCITYIIP